MERESNRAKFWLDPVCLAESGGFSRAEIRRVGTLVRDNANQLRRAWDETLPSERRAALAQQVNVTEDALVVDLVDGRTVSVALLWYPRLAHGTAAERANWRLIGNGEGVHWPDLDEDISIDGLLAGHPSGETQTSLRRWLESRQATR